MTFEKIGNVQTEQAYAFQIMFLFQQGEALFQIEGLEPLKIPMEYPEKSWGYYLFPYFGGNMTAPQDMEVELEMVLEPWGKSYSVSIGGCALPKIIRLLKFINPIRLSLRVLIVALPFGVFPKMVR